MADLILTAPSGLHRGLVVTTAHSDTQAVRAALLDAVAVHDVPCSAEAHEVSLRKQPVGWKVAVRCHNGWAETIHPPTCGTLSPPAVAGREQAVALWERMGRTHDNRS